MSLFAKLLGTLSGQQESNNLAGQNGTTTRSRSVLDTRVVGTHFEIPQHPRVKASTVKDVLEGKAAKLQYLQADATCLEALKVMAEEDVEAVLVADSGGSVGIFSERNFARNSIHAKQLPAAILLGQVMIPCNVVANLGDSVQQCITLMNENQLRYLPVREEGNLIAILSLEDLLYEMVSYLERVFKENQLDLQVASLRGTYSC